MQPLPDLTTDELRAKLTKHDALAQKEGTKPETRAYHARQAARLRDALNSALTPSPTTPPEDLGVDQPLIDPSPTVEPAEGGPSHDQPAVEPAPVKVYINPATGKEFSPVSTCTSPAHRHWDCIRHQQEVGEKRFPWARWCDTCRRDWAGTRHDPATRASDIQPGHPSGSGQPA